MRARLPEVYRMLRLGLSWSAVARACGISRRTVARYARTVRELQNEARRLSPKQPSGDNRCHNVTLDKRSYCSPSTDSYRGGGQLPPAAADLVRCYRTALELVGKPTRVLKPREVRAALEAAQLGLEAGDELPAEMARTIRGLEAAGFQFTLSAVLNHLGEKWGADAVRRPAPSEPTRAPGWADLDAMRRELEEISGTSIDSPRPGSHASNVGGSGAPE